MRPYKVFLSLSSIFLISGLSLLAATSQTYPSYPATATPTPAPTYPAAATPSPTPTPYSPYRPPDAFASATPIATPIATPPPMQSCSCNCPPPSAVTFSCTTYTNNCPGACSAEATNYCNTLPTPHMP